MAIFSVVTHSATFLQLVQKAGADAVCTFIERKQTRQALHRVPLTAHQRLIWKPEDWVGLESAASRH